MWLFVLLSCVSQLICLVSYITTFIDKLAVILIVHCGIRIYYFTHVVEDICPEVSFNSERSSTSITTLFVEQIRLLNKVSVSGYNITDQGVALMATILMETVSLAKLDLSTTMLNSVKATMVINALKNNSSLKVFNISHNDIDDGAADSITAVISSNSRIEIVNLSHNKLSYNGVL